MWVCVHLVEIEFAIIHKSLLIMGLLSLEEQLIQYTQDYRRTGKLNTSFHMIATLLLIITTMMMLTMCPRWIPFDHVSWISISPLYVLISFFSFYYFLLEPIAGTVFGIFCFILAYIIDLMITLLGTGKQILYERLYERSILIIYFSLSVHAICWVVVFLRYILVHRNNQISMRIAHGIERWLRFILFSPFYCFLQLLFLTGYRPALQKRIQYRIKTLGRS